MSMSDYKQQGHYIIFYINERNTSTYDTAMADNRILLVEVENHLKSLNLTQKSKSVALFTEEDATREALRGRYSSPVYDQVSRNSNS